MGSEMCIRDSNASIAIADSLVNENIWEYSHQFALSNLSLFINGLSINGLSII